MTFPRGYVWIVRSLSILFLFSFIIFSIRSTFMDFNQVIRSIKSTSLRF